MNVPPVVLVHLTAVTRPPTPGVPVKVIGVPSQILFWGGPADTVGAATNVNFCESLTGPPQLLVCVAVIV